MKEGTETVTTTAPTVLLHAVILLQGALSDYTFHCVSPRERLRDYVNEPSPCWVWEVMKHFVRILVPPVPEKPTQMNVP